MRRHFFGGAAEFMEQCAGCTCRLTLNKLSFWLRMNETCDWNCGNVDRLAVKHTAKLWSLHRRPDDAEWQLQSTAEASDRTKRSRLSVSL